MTEPAPTAKPKTKIRVRNYQSISDALIEVEGLTVITGKSNLGKSAVIRALRGMLFGAPGEHFIRNGQGWAGGSIMIEDGQGQFKVGWRKVKPQSRTPNLQPVLSVNGVEHTKIGREHASLVTPFGIAEIKASSETFYPQIAGQFDPIFLVTANETAVAEVFKVLGRVDVITEAQKDAKKDLKETNDRRIIRESDKTVAKEKVDEMGDVSQLRAGLDSIKGYWKRTRSEIEERQIHQALIRNLISIEVKDVPEPVPMPFPPKIDGLRLLRDLISIEVKDVPDELKPIEFPDLKAYRYIHLMQAEQKDHQHYSGLVAEVEKELESLLEDRKKLEAEVGICPTCQRSFTESHEHV